MCRMPCWPISVGHYGYLLPCIRLGCLSVSVLGQDHICMTHYFSIWHTLTYTHLFICAFCDAGDWTQGLPMRGYYKYLLTTVWETGRGRLLYTCILWMSMLLSAMCWYKTKLPLPFDTSAFDLPLLSFLLYFFNSLWAEETEENETVPLSFQFHFHIGITDLWIATTQVFF